jgi:hypothetical protein
MCRSVRASARADSPSPSFPATPACPPREGFRFLGFYGLRAARGAPSGFTIRYQCDGGPSGIVINTGPFEHIGFAIFAIEAAGALLGGVLLCRLIIQAALRAGKHDRGLCYGGHPTIMRRWLAGSIRNCPGFEGTRAPACRLWTGIRPRVGAAIGSPQHEEDRW